MGKRTFASNPIGIGGVASEDPMYTIYQESWDWIKEAPAWTAYKNCADKAEIRYIAETAG